MPITCESGFGSYWPPFDGNVKIKNFRLSKEVVKKWEKVRALGKAEIKKWTPWNDWGTYDNATVEIKWAWAGQSKYVTATGKTDKDGRFNIELEGPTVTIPRSVNIWASLPEPSGGYPMITWSAARCHFECCQKVKEKVRKEHLNIYMLHL